VAPLIRKTSTRSFAIDIVGGGNSEALQNLAGEMVHLVGAVPDVRPYYEHCQAVIVPIRAAGGTRIKILEAFGYGRPVISTAIGVEGLDAVHGKHLLIADTPEDFAAACVRVMSDAALTESLIENAGALVQSSYTIDCLRKVVAAL